MQLNDEAYLINILLTMAGFTAIDDNTSYNPATIIVISFLLLIAVLLGYLYVANKALLDKGLHHSKKSGKKSKKGKQVWSLDG
jgi:hypothetical protein